MRLGALMIEYDDMRFKFGKHLSEIIIVVAVAAIVGAGAFYFGYSAGERKPLNIHVEGVTNILDQDVTADFGVFWQAWNYIKNEHVDGDKVPDQDLVYGSITGLVGALDDENSNFFPPVEAKKFEEDVSGSFGGIGAEIGIREGQLVIIAPLKGSPAERAGLKSSDKILEIEGEATSGVDVNTAVTKIRGPEGSDVTLTIAREEWSAPKNIVITRARIEVPTLDHALVGNNLSHIKLYAFNRNAPYQFYQAIVAAAISNSRGLILDLRNNPGGFLDVAVDLAGWFVDRGKVVVTERFRSGDEEIFRANGNEALKDFPVVILVNGGSASASEILAGALRDHRGVKLIGEKTYGKGSVQELKILSDDSSLKLTIAKWVMPSGNVIEDNGLTPDLEVALTEKDAEAKKDPQLDKAIETLEAIISAE